MSAEESSSASSSPLQRFSQMSLSTGLGSPYVNAGLRDIGSEERGLCLIHLLVSCANHVAAGSIENANVNLEFISHLASPNGDTMQRIAAYFNEALADRMLKVWSGLHKALNSTKITSVAEEMLVQKLFFDFCPFLKLSYVITNQAIMEAMQDEKVIHIIDLNPFEPAQWISLIQALSTRPEGPPHLKITGVHEHKEVLDQMARKLNEEAEKLDLPFQFYPIVSKLEDLDVESLGVKIGEAVAISSVLQLHRLLAVDDEMLRMNSPLLSSSPNSAHLHRALQINPRTLGDFLAIREVVNGYTISPDSALSSLTSSTTPPKMMSFLNSLYGLSPKVIVVTEQESNHNGFSVMERIMEALTYYAALFDCLELSGPIIPPTERQKIEKMLYGKEIKNIIACEGLERRDRHEKLVKWMARLEVAGFSKVHLNYIGLIQARRLLQSYNYNGYKVKEQNGCFIICWQDQPLYSVSAWTLRRYS